MIRRRRSLGALGLMAMAILISACGSSPQAATGRGSGGGPTSTNYEKAVRFAKCMRTHGVSAFPDPPASGDLTIDAIANGSALDTNAPAFNQAMSACKNLEPPGFTGQKPTAQQMDARLRFAQCMREGGVPDFPDPTPNGPLIDTNRIPSLAGKDPRTDPGLNAAMRKCRGDAAAAGVGR